MYNRHMYKHSVALCLVFLSILSATLTEGKSLYVLKHPRTTRALFVFDIVGNQLVFQNKIVPPDHGVGPIDVAIDNEAGIIFISYEKSNLEGGGNVIEMYNTFLCHIGTAELSGPTNIAGLVFDKANSRLIAAQRNDNEIWLIDWDPETLQLDTTPSYVNLEGMRHGAAGLALDGNILYVSDYYYANPSSFTKSVHIYDMSDSFSLIETINMDNKVVSIAYSSKDDVIYGGNYGPECYFGVF